MSEFILSHTVIPLVVQWSCFLSHSALAHADGFPQLFCYQHSCWFPLPPSLPPFPLGKLLSSSTTLWPICISNIVPIPKAIFCTVALWKSNIRKPTLNHIPPCIVYIGATSTVPRGTLRRQLGKPCRKNLSTRNQGQEMDLYEEQRGRHSSNVTQQCWCMEHLCSVLHGSAKRSSIPAPSGIEGKFTQPRAHHLADPCMLKPFFNPFSSYIFQAKIFSIEWGSWHEYLSPLGMRLNLRGRA